jgi:tetratricopeptide (TPR) repeat protein
MPDAAAAWGRGDFSQAVMLDPDFGAAWLAWAQKLAAEGNAAEALDVTAQALKRPTLRSEVDRAQIALASATLRKDPDARRNALIDLARLVRTDTSLLETLAEIEFNARRYSEAARRYRELLSVDRVNPSAMNLLGYAEALGGNLDAAKKAFEDYGRQPNEKPNSLDSAGEGYFANGRFAEAEKYFLQAHDADPALGGGSDLLKAAYARWLAGDLPGADAIMKRYLQYRTNLRDPAVVWREAAWEYSTGRTEQAMTRLQSAPPNQKELVEKQMAVWRGSVKLPGDLASLQDLYQRTSPTADGVPRMLYATALVAAGRKDEARKVLTLWPLPAAGGDPLLQSLVYPKFLELRRAVGLT